MERAREHKNESQRESKHEARQELAGRFEDEQGLEVPDAYECPITTELMQDPVIAADGHSYERTAIEEWLRSGRLTSPMTNEELPHRTLTPNHNLRKLIQDFIAKRPILQQEKRAQHDLLAASRLREEELQTRLEKEEKRRIAEEKQKEALAIALAQEQARATALEQRLAQQNVPSSSSSRPVSSSALSFFQSSTVEKKMPVLLPPHSRKKEEKFSPKLVLQWQQLAEQGDAEAQFNIGACYANGRGVTKDVKEGVVWYRKAAAQNHAEAQYRLGCCHHGIWVTKDEQQLWLYKAAQNNHANAQYVLGMRYANGRGVAVDKNEAMAWYQHAAAQGHTTAAWAYKNLAAEIAPSLRGLRL